MPFAGALIALARMRSNENPGLAMTTFLCLGPLFAVEFVWATIAAALHTRQWLKRRETIVDTAGGSTAAP